MYAFHAVPIGLVGACLVLAGCGSDSKGSNTTGGGTVPVSLTIADTPPNGVAVLSFEITVNAAVLEPGNVALISTPSKIEVSRLETERAFLNTKNAPADTYQSIHVTFANPELTIINNSAAAIGSCAVGRVCELKPTLVQSSVSYTGSPFPLTLAAGTGVGLLLDLDLMNSIQGDLSVNPSITVAQVPAAGGDTHDNDLDDVSGQVTAVDTTNKQFSLSVGGSSGQTLTIITNSSTEFEDFEEAGLANAFSSIAVGQLLEVDSKLDSAGQLIAKEVELSEHKDERELEGVIVSANGAGQFTMVVHDEEPDVPGVEVGNSVAVVIQDGASFEIDEEDLTIPSGLVFHSAADLMVGQHVQIRPASAVSGTPLTTTTNRVRLKESSVTATVRSVGGSSITIDNLPALFSAANPVVTAIEVETSRDTEFLNVSGLSGLSSGDRISTSGLLFKTSSLPVLVAEKVRKR